MKVAAMYEITRARLMMVASLLMILGLFGLDLRDLYYKLHMLGPYDSYSFRTVGYDTIQSQPIPKPVDTIAKLVNGSATAASGWPSFYSRCETMYASGTETSRFFLTTLAHNCSIELSANETRVVPQILVTASMRVDALVAVSCGLLFIGRRPPICQDAMAIGYNERYQIEEEAPTFDEMAQPHSYEEVELLRFLDMVSFSYPMTHVTCGEAFELAPGAKGVFRSSVYVCSSPNLFRSEWIGFVNKAVSRFLVTKGWLTADVISFMGVRYGIRQNSIDIYDVSYSSSGKMQLSSSSLVNFSSYGHLYAISVLIDILLLIAHCLSTFEVLKWILLPQYLELQAWIHDFEDESPQLAAPQSMKKKGLFSKLKKTLTHMGSGGTEQKYSAPPQSSGSTTNLQAKPLVHAATDGGAIVFEEVQFYSFFSRSFYRNEHYVLLTTITQVLSWVIILPNSVIWTWSDSLTQQIQGYLSSIKCWVLIASSINFLWDIIVKLDERRAYWFVRGTYLTNPEIIAIGALVAFAERQSIFSISGAKYTLEKQRHYDFSSFPDGYLGYSNAYDKSQDHLTTTPLQVAWLVYKPLVTILLYSLLTCAIYLTLKYAFFYYMEREGRDTVLRLLGRPVRPRGAAVHISDSSTPAGNVSQDAAAPPPSAPAEYCRLPLEEALGCPIRAISLVRNTLSMEIIKDGKTYIRPSCYLDFGVMLKNGHVETRVGFNDIFKAQMPINTTSAADASEATMRQLTTRTTMPTVGTTGTSKSLLTGSAHKALESETDGLAPETSLRSDVSVSPTRKSPRGMSATAANASMSGRTFRAEQFAAHADGLSDAPAETGPRGDAKPRLPPLERPPRVPTEEDHATADTD